MSTENLAQRPRWCRPVDKIRANQILNLKIAENYADANTIREYLTDLLSTLWEDSEGFDSKRPFGFSDWQSVVYKALIKAKEIPGSVEEDGYLNFDKQEADELIVEAIYAWGTTNG